MNFIDIKGVGALVERLECLIDFSLDLPADVFIGDDWSYWFYERSIFSSDENFMQQLAHACEDGGVFFKFSGAELIQNSCVYVVGREIERICELAVDFNGGMWGYPMTAFDSKFNFVALESAYEEYGVVGLKGGAGGVFFDLFNKFLITVADMRDFSQEEGRLGRISKAFKNYWERG